MVKTINKDDNIKIVLIQHEFGFFKSQEQSFLRFLYKLNNQLVVVELHKIESRFQATDVNSGRCIN